MPTSRLNLPYPAPTDPADGPANIEGLADALDPITAIFAQGSGSPPVAGTTGRLWFDGSALWYDNGASWARIGPAVPAVGAHIYLTSSPSISAGDNPCFYNATLWDTGGIADPGNFRIVTPHTGIFVLAGQMEIGGGTGQLMHMAIRVNGVDRLRGVNMPVNPNAGLMVAGVAQLNAGDAIMGNLNSSAAGPVCAGGAGAYSYLALASL